MGSDPPKGSPLSPPNCSLTYHSLSSPSHHCLVMSATTSSPPPRCHYLILPTTLSSLPYHPHHLNIISTTTLSPTHHPHHHIIAALTHHIEEYITRRQDHLLPCGSVINADVTLIGAIVRNANLGEAGKDRGDSLPALTPASLIHSKEHPANSDGNEP